MIPLRDNIPTRRFPILTVALIAICVFVYFFLQHGGLNGPSEESVVKYGAIPYEITHPGKHCGLDQAAQIACEGQSGVSGHAPPQPSTWLTILFAMFMHGGLLHLGYALSATGAKRLRTRCSHEDLCWFSVKWREGALRRPSGGDFQGIGVYRSDEGWGSARR